MRFLVSILLSLTIQLHATELMKVDDIYHLSLKAEADTFKVLYQNLNQHSKALTASGGTDYDFLDLLFALRTLPQEEYLLNECEAVFSQRGYIILLLTKHTGYDKIYFNKTEPSVLFHINEDYQKSLLKWYKEKYASGRTIKTFKL